MAEYSKRQHGLMLDDSNRAAKHSIKAMSVMCISAYHRWVNVNVGIEIKDLAQRPSSVTAVTRTRLSHTQQLRRLMPHTWPTNILTHRLYERQMGPKLQHRFFVTTRITSVPKLTLFLSNLKDFDNHAITDSIKWMNVHLHCAKIKQMSRNELRFTSSSSPLWSADLKNAL